MYHKFIMFQVKSENINESILHTQTYLKSVEEKEKNVKYKIYQLEDKGIFLCVLQSNCEQDYIMHIQNDIVKDFFKKLEIYCFRKPNFVTAAIIDDGYEIKEEARVQDDTQSEKMGVQIEKKTDNKKKL